MGIFRRAVGELWPENILVVGELRPEYYNIIYNTWQMRCWIYTIETKCSIRMGLYIFLLSYDKDNRDRYNVLLYYLPYNLHDFNIVALCYDNRIDNII